MKINKNLLSLIPLTAVAVTTITSVFAWYVSTIGITQDLSDGKLAANATYYESGTGTESDPFIISNARHLYNLAWLQDLGKYDDKVYYFELKNDIDMSQLKIGSNSASPIPAIGIDDHPFISSFNGNGHTINNLFVATSFSSSSYIKPSQEVLNNHNQNQDKKTYNTESNTIISSYNGLFGVIKKFNDSKDSESKVTNFTIANAKIESSQDTLVGYICGYVNSDLSNIGVASSNLTIGTGVTHITTTSTTYPISKYGIVGDYNNADGGIEWSQNSGQNNGWGGSIDISSLSKRVTFITNNSTLSKGSETSYPTYTSSDFGTSFYQSPNKYTWDYSEKNSGQYSALEGGTYLPLNIDTSTINETYYTKNKKESILSTNTGYIVGYGSGGNAGPRVTNKLTNSDANGIKYSLANQANSIDSSKRSEVFTQSNIALFYYDTINKTTSRILDDYNSSTTFKSGPTDTVKLSNLKLQKYTNVKEQFIDMLDSGTSDINMKNKKIVLNGIQIFKQKEDNLSKLTANNVTLNGKTYGSYQFYTGGFNFTLKSNGIFTMIVGCYTTSATHQLPQIFKVERNTNNEITTKTEIKTIYQDSTGIYYNSDKGTTIDLTSMTANQVLLQSCAYYIEVPLTAGDYFFASIDQKNNCPYILYLDIGANAGDSGNTYIGTIKDIDYTYYTDSNKTGYALVNTDSGFTLSGVYFNIDGTTTKEVALYVMRSLENTHLVYYYFVSDGGLTNKVTGTATKKDSLDDWKNQE